MTNLYCNSVYKIVMQLRQIRNNEKISVIRTRTGSYLARIKLNKGATYKYLYVVANKTHRDESWALLSNSYKAGGPSSDLSFDGDVLSLVEEVWEYLPDSVDNIFIFNMSKDLIEGDGNGRSN